MTSDSGSTTVSGEMSDRRGGCLCGAVHYRIDGPVGPVLHCHCENCRRLSGSFVAACRVATDDLTVGDADGNLGWHGLGYARYGFCRSCGSTLFYVAADTEEVTSVMVGTLDQADDLTLKAVWFADEAQPHARPLPNVILHATNG